MADAKQTITGDTSISALKTHCLQAAEDMYEAMNKLDLSPATPFKFTLEVVYDDGQPEEEEKEDVQSKTNKRNKN